ncbi:PIN domain-containing protein [Patescibacteria group bacterium]|nr:PIN domain-containing protein [Patescibacteria group bacterium]MCG2701680.1 PIN domain-containing protein [Candidatus Parcubacteria bacterium]MBU4210086.1 PIN domain-containing protein [Patescibacteria group bacterium]MBU4265385.1 PIN domain-containing protein [Patescibacteria group bacterium]MBU4390337.1 PIN domain-containing protein [Patescibacteria group bacterium]
MIFVDTNYFLRFFLKDNQNQCKIAQKLFQQASIGKIKLFTSIIVFFEVYWVLKNIFSEKDPKVFSILFLILDMSFIQIPKRDLLKDCLTNIEFYDFDMEDAYNAIYALKNKTLGFKTFDKKLLKKFNLLNSN